VITHEVDDVAHWLSSPKRAEVFDGIVTDLQTYVLPGADNKIALSMTISDMAAFDAVLKSEAGAEAMKYDGVRPDTIVMYMEG
jgi:hypothetical protein